MSHLKQRMEKTCLNCYTEVQGRFCHNCGQENIEPKETVWHLFSHFFQDITHFDGKFFSTLKYLFTKPGFLPKEYMIGRRASYVNPVRMYVFTSAFFFVIFFSMIKVDRNTIVDDAKVQMNGKTYAQIESMDSLGFDAFTKNVNKEDGKVALPMSRLDFKKYFDSVAPKGYISFTNTEYRSKARYDSALKTGAAKNGWLMRKLIYKQIDLNERYNNEGGDFVKDYLNILLHSLPQLLFILLPLFALILKFLYKGQKEYFYVNHSIFTIHIYIFTFILMLVMFGIKELNSHLNWSFLNFLQATMSFGIFFYLYKAMRKFYGQPRAKTIFKFLTFCLLMWVMVILSIFTLFIFSLYKL
jgi:hypothetical protein